MSASTNHINDILNKESKDKKPVVPMFDAFHASIKPLFLTFVQDDTDREMTAEEFFTSHKNKLLGKNYLENGQLYLLGFDATNDKTKAANAFEFFKKAADLQNPEAQYLLRCCYEKAIGVAKDNKLAVEWYNIAARNGHRSAGLRLADCYLIGDLGLTINVKEANEWMRRAKGENSDPIAALGNLNLGNLSFNH